MPSEIQSSNVKENYFLLTIFIVLAGALAMGVRLLPHAPNFTPMGALALFVGAYLARTHKAALLIPVLLMFLSDLFIGFYDLRLMAVVYASFLVYGIIGMFVIKQKSAPTVLLGSIGGALFFYLATNFAVWAFSPFYTHNIQGLLLSYEMALPFFRFTLLGDLFFTGVFFGSYEFVIHFLRQRELKLSRA
jgi:hypothetical protein